MDNIIDRIKKLLALSASPNENEAAQAAAKAQELLMQHNISLEDVKEKQTEAEIKIDIDLLEANAKKILWKGRLANAIADANFCKFFWRKGQMQITGKPHNIAIARSIYEYLVATIDRLATAATKAEKRNYQSYLTQIANLPIMPYPEPNWRTWKTSFIVGCASRLTERIREQSELMEREGIAGTNVTGLACRQAKTREAEAIALALSEQGIRLRNTVSRSNANITRDGYAAGQKAGDSISLNRQMANATGGGRFLR